MSRVSSSSVSDARKITKRQPKRKNRCLKPLLAAAFAVPVIGSFGTASAVLYWDSNGTTAGSASTSGSWSENKWSTDQDGLIATGAWATDSAVFSAGTNGTGTFTLTIDGGSRNTSAGLTIEEGNITFDTTTSANIVAMGTGTLTIKTGATLSVDNSAGFFETSHTLGGGGVILDGGTLRDRNTTSATTFYASNATIGLGTGGTGTVSADGGAGIVHIWQGQGLIGTQGSGATTANGGAGTFTKSGTGEFRFQNAGTAASTYSKLVVTGGLFRTGSTTGSSELGFGAAPTASLADAITLNGGGIGTTASTTLHSNRGITIGASGGNISTVGTLTVPSLLSGSGQFTQTAGSTTLSNAGNNASFTGSLNMAGGTLTLSQSLTATQLTASVTTATISVSSSRTLTVGNNDASTNYNGLIAGAGTFTKVGNGTITLAPAAEWSNTGGVIISAGSLRFNAGAMGFASTVTVTVNNGGTLDMNNINDTFGALAGTATGVVTTGTGNITLAGTQSTTYNGTITTTTGDLTKASTSTGTSAFAGALTIDALTVNAGTLNLNAANTINTIQLNAGRTNFNNNTAGGTAPITVANAAGIDLTSSIGTVAITNGITLNGSGANAVRMYTTGTLFNVGGVIQGTGGIVRDNTGAGTLILSGNNNFAGGVQVISRGLVVGHQNALGIGTLTLGDTVTAPANAIGISSNTALTGASAIPNAITVNRDFSVPDNTFVVGGNFDIELAGSMDLGGVSRIVTVASTASTIFSGVIGGTTGSALVKSGTGALTITNANTYDGGTTVSAGTLLAGAANTLPSGGAVTVAGGTLDIAANNQSVGAVTLVGGAINGSSGVLTATSYDVRSGSASAILAGTGAVMDKTTGGTVTLTGANTYTGGTNVSAGTLLVNNTTGSGAVTVSGGTLGGTGSIAGSVNIQTGATLAPGASPGTLTMDSLDLDAGAILSYEIGTSSDKADVTSVGGLTLDSGTNTITLNFTDSGGLAIGSYTLIDYNTSYAGNVASIGVGTNPGGFNFSVVDNTTNTSIDLVVASAGPNQWKDLDGTWADASSWTNALVPNAQNAVAIFGALATAPHTVLVNGGAKTVGIMQFNSGFKYSINGTDAVHISDSGGTGTIHVANGSHDINAPLVLDSDAFINVGNLADTLKVTDLTMTGKSINKIGLGTLEVDKMRGVGVTVGAGKIVVTASTPGEPGSGTKNSQISSLSMTSGATIDLTNNNLIVKATDATDAGIKYAALEPLVISGFGNFDWLGTGITSSTAAAQAQIDGSRALGIIDNTFWGHSDVEGDPVGPNDIIIKYTWVADANVDGLVDNDDFGQFLFGFDPNNAAPAIWLNGDFDYDGDVDNDDFGWFLTGLGAFNASGNTQLSDSFKAELAAFASEQGIPLVLDPTPVPEPTTLGVLGLAGAGMLARRRRKA